MSSTCRAATLLLIMSGSVGLSAQTDEDYESPTLASPPFYQTSFDCRKARQTSVEEAICKNEELAKLDVEMADTYRKRLAAANASERSELIPSQRRWLVLRNSYNVNPYHGDPVGVLADLSDLYRSRVAALRSGQMALLNTEPPAEYEWLKTVTTEGFEKKKFGIGRAYGSCDNPCERNPSLYRWISVGGGGVGWPPGDVDKPFDKTVKKLTSEGWRHCRTAEDSGQPEKVDYFKKGDRLVALSRSYSMGAGNGIGFGVTISGPLAQPSPKLPPNPVVTVGSDWNTYSSPEVGLQLRYPHDWWVRDGSPPGSDTKYVSFGNNWGPGPIPQPAGNFEISVQREQDVARGPINPDNWEEPPKCYLSRYRVSGFPAQECISEYEVITDGFCERNVAFVDVSAGKYHLDFRPPVGGSFVDSKEWRLTDLYEKILSTIQIKQKDQ